jgi:hypothetical protein
MTYAKLQALVASTALAQKELVAQQRRTDAQIAATNIQLAKTDAQLAKTDAQLAKTDAQLAKTDAQLAKTDAQLDRVSRKLDRLGELVGGISNNQGDMAEEFFYRSYLKNPVIGSMRFDTISRHLNTKKGNVEEEYDLVLINGDSLVVIEVKAKAHEKDLLVMVERKMPNFPILFKEFSHYRRFAGIATLVSNDTLVARAKELGLFLITQQGDHQIVVQEGRVFT